MKSISRQQGAALIIILALVVTAMVVFITSTFSVNDLRIKATDKSIDALAQAKQALLGFALSASPPGQLPCPDADGDGLQDVTAGQCSVRVGGFPFVTLNAPELRDGYNNVLWYSPNPNLYVASGFKINSSTTTPLIVDGVSSAFVLIAPGKALDDQTRDSNAAVSDYLEGINADSDPDTFAQVIDESHNDIVYALSDSAYWSLLEGSIVKRVAQVLQAYLAACGEYPWAANFGLSPAQSVDSLTQGNVPFDLASPVDWNSGCASGISPADWMSSEWGTEIYYAMCSPADWLCLNISGDTSGSYAAVLLAPGVNLAGQNRPSFDLANYYESDNAVVNDQFTWLEKVNFDENFNDIAHPISP